MKYIFIINAVAFLLGCGSYQLSEQAGSVQSVRIPKLNSVSEALAFLRTHPAIKTTGIPLAVLSAELNIPPKQLGRYINADSYLVTELLQVAGKSSSIIFAKGSTPREQVDAYIGKLDAEMLRSGVPIAQVVAAVNYTRNLSPKSSNMSVGINLDKEKYFVRLIKINGNKQLFIFPRYVQRLVGIGGEYEEFTFAEDDTPNVRISAYLEKLAPEKLKQGVSVAQVGNNIVKYGRDDWSREDFHTSISLYLDRDKYTTTFIIVNGKAETYIFAKDLTPHAQIRNYLKSLDPKMLKSEGVSVAQVGNNVSYRQQGQSSEDFYRAIRWYVHGREGYVTRMIRVDKEKHELRIFIE